MTDRRELAAHLTVFRDLGVSGFSRDSAWQQRGAALPAEASIDPNGPMEPVESNASDASPVVVAAGDSPRPSHVATEAIDPAVGLAALRQFIGPACTRCKLGTLGRKQVVFGSGSPTARLMFAGEAPGADEDAQGEPFVGRAGQLLTKIIEAIGLSRADVYIANVLKCRPPGNRNPEPDEVATCQPFLLEQIALVKPRVIVALGTFAAQTLLQTQTPISRLRGQVHEFRDGIKLVPTFHPAFLLRSPDRKRDVWEDMKIVRGLLAGD